MFGSHHTSEVLVVGAGPVGLLTALLLADRDVDVRIIDAAFRTGSHSYALGLHPHSLKLLEEVGAAHDAIEQGYRIDTLALYDERERRVELRLRELPCQYPYVLALRQDMVESILEQRLNHARRHVEWNHRVSALQARGEHWGLTIETLGKQTAGYAVATLEEVVERTIRTEARFVIGADGHRSFIRRALEIPFEPAGATAQFAVFEFQTDAEIGPEMRLVLRPGDINVVWPLPGRRVRWSFQVGPNTDLARSREKQRLAVQIADEAYPHLEESDLRNLLAERAPWFRGTVGQIDWSMVVQFDRRLAREFGRDHIWLLGDAAHMTWPAGMQSMNLGMREAYELAWRITRILRDGEDDELLREFARERRAEWTMLLGLSGPARARPDADPWIAANAERILPCLPASGVELRVLLRELKLDAGFGEK